MLGPVIICNLDFSTSIIQSLATQFPLEIYSKHGCLYYNQATIANANKVSISDIKLLAKKINLFLLY